MTKALRLKILPGQQLSLFPNPPTLLTCHSTGKPGEPCRPAPPPAAPLNQGLINIDLTPRTPTNSLHQGDRPASQANPTGTRRGDSVITDVIMTLFSCHVSAGQKRHPNNTVGAAAVHLARADRVRERYSLFYVGNGKGIAYFSKGMTRIRILYCLMKCQPVKTTCKELWKYSQKMLFSVT